MSLDKPPTDDLQNYKRLDDLVEEIKSLDFYHYTIPENDTEEREKFKKNEIDEPDFDYPELSNEDRQNINELWEELGRIDVPENDSIKAEVYERTLAECAEVLTIIENVSRRIENPDLDGTLTGKGSMIFGSLSEEAAATAEEWLENGYEGAVESSHKMMSPEEIKAAFEERLDEDGVRDEWNVILYDRNGMRVNASGKKIYVPEERNRPETRVDNLLNHEYEGHAKRAVNGLRQPWKILSTGTGGFEPMSEGLAVYLEDATDTLTEERAEELAARAKAAEMHQNDLDWRENYETLTEEFGVDEDTAFTAVKRAKKVGGLQQGQVYLTGYEMMKEAAEEYSEEEIYAGKISFDDLEDGILDHPEIETPQNLPGSLG